MFMHPEIASQLIRDRQRQMLAEASQRRLLYQQHHPATAARAKDTMRKLIISLTAAAAAALCAVLATLGAAPAAPAIASADAAAVAGTWFATDLGPGGHAGGNLLSGGAATGSGELAFPTPNGQFTAHVQAFGWSPLSPTTDGVIVNDSAGDTFCFVLPVTKGAPSHDIGVSFSSDCSLASPAPGAAGKVNPIP